MFSAIEPVKKENTEMSFYFSIRPSHLISEITTCHVCRQKRLKARVTRNDMFL